MYSVHSYYDDSLEGGGGGDLRVKSTCAAPIFRNGDIIMWVQCNFDYPAPQLPGLSPVQQRSYAHA